MAGSLSARFTKMKSHISIRVNKITERQIAELRERYSLQQTEVITMAVNQFYKSKMEDRMSTKTLLDYAREQVAAGNNIAMEPGEDELWGPTGPMTWQDVVDMLEANPDYNGRADGDIDWQSRPVVDAGQPVYRVRPDRIETIYSLRPNGWTVVIG